jgi:predicted  nucleic acid-binding Zn ribbon protein
MPAIATKSFTVLVTGLMLMSGAALAGREDTIEANRDILNQRIEQGRYNGQITRREYRDLKAEEARIDADIKRALADGRLSKGEYERLHNEQLAAFKNVKEDSTNHKVSFWRRWLYNHRN